MRPFTLWIASLSLGSAVVRAADPPQCLSTITLAQVAQAPNAQQPAASTTAPSVQDKQSAPASKSKNPADAGIDVDADHITYTPDGTAVLKGNVEAHQGDRHIKADQIEVDSRHRTIKARAASTTPTRIVHVSARAATTSPTGARTSSRRSSSCSSARLAVRGIDEPDSEGILNLNAT